MTLSNIAKLNKNELRRFGYTTGTILVVLFGLLLPWLLKRPCPRWPWIVTVVLSVWATIAPLSMQPVYRTWMKVGALLGWINSRLLLGLVFYAVIFPVGVLSRAFSRDPMARKFDTGSPSYRVPSKRPSRDNMKRPF